MKRQKLLYLKLPTNLRDQLARFILECRGRDLAEESNSKKWLSQSRSLGDYCDRLGILPDYLKAIIELKIFTSGRVRILDVGVGRGEAIRDLTHSFGEAVHSCGVGLTYRSFSGPKHYRHRVGLFETISLNGEKFDFIFSVRGGFAYALNSFIAIECALNSLETQGMAFLEDSRLLLAQGWFRDYLKNHGFEVFITRYEEGRPDAYQIIRPDPQNLDLNAFSERYFSLLNGRREDFLRWGFDRMGKDSPLNSIYGDLYSAINYGDLLH